MRAATSEDTLGEQCAALTRLAKSLVRADDAEDVVQDAFVALHRTEGVRSPVAWLRGTVRRIASKRHRSHARMRRRERTQGGGHVEPATDQVVEALEAQRHLMRALACLSDGQRTALEMRYFDDLQPREIAARLGVPVATIKGRIHRGLRAMRVELDKTHEGSRTRWQLALMSLVRTSAAGPRVAWASVMLWGSLVLAVAMLGWWFVGLAAQEDAGSTDFPGLVQALPEGHRKATLRGAPSAAIPPGSLDRSLPRDPEPTVLNLNTRPPWTFDLIFDIALPRGQSVDELDLASRRVTAQVVDAGGRQVATIEGFLQSSSRGWACRLGLASLVDRTPAERAKLCLIPSIDHPRICVERPSGEYALRLPIWSTRTYRRATVHCTWGERRSFSIVSDDGKPVPGASVVISTPDDDSTGPKTDARGQFEWALPSWADSTVTVYHSKHGFMRQKLSDTAHTTIRLTGSHWLEGTVSLESGEPVPHLPIRVGPRGADAELNRVQYTDASGRFRVAVERAGEGVFELVDEGSWGPTYSLPLEGGVHNTIRLPWSGITLDPVGESGWHASSLHLAWWASQADRPGERPHPEAPLSNRGSFHAPRFPLTLLGIPGSRATLRFGSAGQGLRMVEPLRFPESGIVQGPSRLPAPDVPGEVHLDLKTERGERCSLQHWRLLQRPESESSGAARYVLGDTQRELEAAQRSQAGFVLRDLPPGEWLLWLQAAPETRSGGGSFGLCRPYVPVSVRSGEVTRVSVRVLPSARLSIRLDAKHEAEPTRCHLRLRRLPADGSLRLWNSPGLTPHSPRGISPNAWLRVNGFHEPGRYELHVWLGSGERFYRMIELRPGAELREVFSLPGR